MGNILPEEDEARDRGVLFEREVRKACRLSEKFALSGGGGGG